ncbi:penicillin-binding protein [Bacillus tianshenii]|nr:penicillin-binding protein [Bacillus tianshenii]
MYYNQPYQHGHLQHGHDSRFIGGGFGFGFVPFLAGLAVSPLLFGPRPFPYYYPPYPYYGPRPFGPYPYGPGPYGPYYRR